MLHSFAWLGGGTRAAVWYLDLRLPSYRKSAVPGGLLAYGTVTTAVTVVLGYSSGLSQETCAAALAEAWSGWKRNIRLNRNRRTHPWHFMHDALEEGSRMGTGYKGA